MSDREWDQDRIRSVTVQGWEFQEFVDDREEAGLFETNLTLESGVGALIQEQDYWWQRDSQRQVVVSLMVDIPGTWHEPPDVAEIGEWVVESFEEALRFLRWWDTQEMRRQWSQQVEEMRWAEEQEFAERMEALIAEERGL